MNWKDIHTVAVVEEKLAVPDFCGAGGGGDFLGSGELVHALVRGRHDAVEPGGVERADSVF